jgi:hypothetical protein
VCPRKECSDQETKLKDEKNEEVLNEKMKQNAIAIHDIIKKQFKSQYMFFDGNIFLKKEVEKMPDLYELVFGDKEKNIFVYKLK